MSPGIRTISQLDLPLAVPVELVKCPKCGRGVEVRYGPNGMMRVACKSEPAVGTKKWEVWDKRCYRDVDWNPLYATVGKWFDQYFKFRPLQVETVKRKRRVKWRRV